MTDPNAAAALDSGQTGTDNEQAEESQSPPSFFIPKDVVEETGYKEGDKTITLSVIGTDQDGDLEVTGQGESGSGEDWRSELKTKLSQADNGGTQ